MKIYTLKDLSKDIDSFVAALVNLNEIYYARREACEAAGVDDEHALFGAYELQSAYEHIAARDHFRFDPLGRIVSFRRYQARG